MSHKRANLTPEERLCVAYAHYILGIEQQDLSHIYATNIARINEACSAIGAAMHDKMTPKETKTTLSQLGLFSIEGGEWNAKQVS